MISSDTTNLDTINEFLLMSEQEVFDKFEASCNGNCTTNTKHDFDYRYLFIQGTRKDAVLLVAHADTVWNDGAVEIKYNDGIFYSGNRGRGISKKSGYPYVTGIGIGADDRAGCALLWRMRDLGHSILITNGEESGCLGASQLMANSNLANIINEHQFVMQFDRHGRNDLVFYNVGTNEFQDYCKDKTGYKVVGGSNTDITTLCERICGVNISVGYKNEHSSNELLIYRWWKNTFELVHEWMSKEIEQQFTL